MDAFPAAPSSCWPRLAGDPEDGDRRLVVDQLAAGQWGVATRDQLYALGISRGEVRANVRAGPWQLLGANVIPGFRWVHS